MKKENPKDTTLRPTLEEVHVRFEIWRSRKKAGSPIPKALWEAAVSQCQEHSILEVSRSLRLNYNDLKSRVQEAQKKALPSTMGNMEFVELDLEGVSKPPECIVELEAANGAKLRLHYLGHQKDIDPVELIKVFWRQGL
jgi:hypothetical protein